MQYVYNEDMEVSHIKTVTLRMEDSTKDELDQILASMGMNIATFYNLYTLRTIRDRNIAFSEEAEVSDKEITVWQCKGHYDDK